jgi:hypothetical protein
MLSQLSIGLTEQNNSMFTCQEERHENFVKKI